MKKFIAIFSLCLLAVSCSTQQNSSVYNKLNPQPIVQAALNSTSTKNTIKNAVINELKNTVTPSPAPSPTKTSGGSFGGQAPLPVQNEPAVLPKDFVNLKIITPSGENTLSVQLDQNQNACTILNQAKKENKITSLIIKDDYLATYGSLYVYEINGLKNIWTFKVNGQSSTVGCSKVLLKNADSVEWKYD